MLSLTGGNYDHNLTDRHNNTAPAADTARRIPTGDAAVRLALAAVTRPTATRAIRPDTTHRHNSKWKSCHTWVTPYRVASGRCPRLTGRRRWPLSAPPPPGTTLKMAPSPRRGADEGETEGGWAPHRCGAEWLSSWGDSKKKKGKKKRKIITGWTNLELSFGMRYALRIYTSLHMLHFAPHS